MSFISLYVHDMRPIKVRDYASSETSLGGNGPFGADTIQNKSLECLK
jgi:hypothetical protein